VGVALAVCNRYLMRRCQFECSACDDLLTVEHLLVDCSNLMQTRQQYFNEPSLQAVFDFVSPRKIVDFIKAIGFYRKL
jgi:hypothetical protein